MPVLVPNAYTIGDMDSYEAALDTSESVWKLGRTEDYGGGWVWRTAPEAQAFISTVTFPARVYGLILPTGWDSDVGPVNPADGVHVLLVKAQVIRL